MMDESDLRKRIDVLRRENIFESPEIDRLGYGTFLKKGKKDWTEQAKVLKKKAEDTMNCSEKDRIRMHIEAIFLYIKGYSENKHQNKIVDVIHQWKFLRKYTETTMKILDPDDMRIHNLFNLILFNIKFHYLYLESTLVCKQYKSGKSKDGSQMLYFLKEFNNIYEMCVSRTFSIISPYDLEDFVREKGLL
jgi:hypothetical protein